MFGDCGAKDEMHALLDGFSEECDEGFRLGRGKETRGKKKLLMTAGIINIVVINVRIIIIVADVGVQL